MKSTQAFRLVCEMALFAVATATAQESREISDEKPISGKPVAEAPAANRSTAMQPSSDRFASFDSNKDGKISETEYMNANIAAFEIMDRDRNGTISGVELTEEQPASSDAPLPLSPTQIGEVDANKDARLTMEELSSSVSRVFKDLDVNGDKFLSKNELNRRYKSHNEAHKED